MSRTIRSQYEDFMRHVTSDRSYRDAWQKDKVLEYIRAESGKHFDPKVTETFLTFILNEMS